MADPSTYGARVRFQRAVTARDDTVAFEPSTGLRFRGLFGRDAGQQCRVLLPNGEKNLFIVGGFGATLRYRY